MLSIFPGLLTYQLISPLLIRIVLGAIFVFWSYQTLFKYKALGTYTKLSSVLEGIAGILLIVCLFTQLASLYLLADLLVRLYKKVMNKNFLTDGVNYYLILLVLAISLLLTGPGFLALDLPL